MGGFILFLLLIVLFVVLFIISAGLSILRGILSIFTGKKTSSTRNGNPFFGQESPAEESRNRKENAGEKIFTKDEGEYVDFVEYKDDDRKPN